MEVKIMKDDNYIVIQGWMINKLNLKGNELLCYALVYGFSQDNESEFIGSASYVAEWLNIDKRRVLDVLKRLTEKGYLQKSEKFIANNVKLCSYKAVKNVTPHDETSSPHDETSSPHDETSSNNIVNNKTNKTLSKDSVAQTNNFEFGSNKLYKPKKKTNDEEYLDSCLLITNFTSDINLQNKLKELFNNKKDICGQNGIHYFATTCKNYLEELSKVKDKLGAVNLSLEYNNTMKVMEPITKSSNGFVDNITASQKKSNLADKARDKNGNLITF
jgi:hypothetical protein